MQGHVRFEKRPSQITLELEAPSNLNVTIDRGGQAASITVVHGSAYLKADAAFYQHAAGVPSAAVALVANRWIKAPTASLGQELVKGLDLATLAKCLIGEVAREPGEFALDGMSNVNGQSAIAITAKGTLPGSTPGKIYVAATGTPYLLRAVTTGKQRPGGTRHAECNEAAERTEPGEELTFSRYNSRMNIVAPSGALELSQLAHQL